MNKSEFLEALKARISHLPQKEIEERVGFYAEMIDDKMEEGLSEEDAVLSIGSIDEITADVVADKVKRESKRCAKLKTWQIVLIAVGSPVWGAVLISLAAAVISLYASLWAIVVSAWAVFGALVGGALGGIARGIGNMILGDITSGVIFISAALVCAGAAVFAFIGSIYLTKLAVFIPKKIAACVKSCKCRVEEAK